VPITTTQFKETFEYNSLMGVFQGMILAEKPEDIPLIKEEFRFMLSQVEYPNPEKFDHVMTGADTFFETLSRMFFSEDRTESHPERLLAIIVLVMVLFMVLPAIGLRRALGCAGEKIYVQFVGELVIVTTIGVGLGAALVVQFPLLDLMSFVSNQVYIASLAVSLLLIYLLVIGCSLYPSRMATRVQPVDALHYECRKNGMILIVDDDASVTTSLALLLKQAGYRSRTAANPAEGKKTEGILRWPCK